MAIENDPMLSPREKEQRKRLCMYGQLGESTDHT